MTKKKSKAQILKRREKKTERGVAFTLLKWTLVFFCGSGIIAAAGLSGLYFYISRDLPKIISLKDYTPPIVTSVFSDDGRKIGEFYNERRIVIPLSEMPDNLKNAVVAAEDSRFREHPGIDLLSIFRAFVKNLKAGAIVQGGSTITQQVTKSFFLTPARTYERKLKEAILAYRIDQTFTKDEILYLYLNQIYLGHGAYGVEAASENYFGKHAREMNLAECSLLAGLPQAPSRYSPFRNPELARQRQIYVLNRMKADGYITNLEATDAINTVLDIKPRKNWFIERVPCYTEHVRRYVEEKYGRDVLYTQGLKIYTAVNIELQKIARQEVVKGVRELDRRQGYRGVVKHLAGLEVEAFCAQVATTMDVDSVEPGVVYQAVVTAVNDREAVVRVGNVTGVIPAEDITWARHPDVEKAYWADKVDSPKKVFDTGDVVLVKAVSPGEKKALRFTLEQTPLVEAALLSIEAETGQVKAMIGGRDYLDSQFNRAIQSRRQPGSAFKPVIFAAALDKGYTPATVIIDSPVVFKDHTRNFVWKPHNYKEKFYGPTLMREALIKSRNVVTVKILQDIGIDYVINYARKLGVTAKINRDLSISLGSSGMSLVELVNVYSVFSNLGYRIDPVFITRIEDRFGKVIESSELKREKIMDMTTAYMMTSMLESVVKSGTGWRVKALDRPAAGKTGTTNNLHDAWFMGYTPRYTTGVWVGFDNERSLGNGETGSRAASPIWLGYMKGALEGRPVRTFNVPEGIVFVKIDAKTGLLPSGASQETLFECFKDGTAPTMKTPEPGIATDTDDLYKFGI
ncbi:MrcA [Desulforapulum autotrophicum HRM2]|uniref:Penicillin-binding protein 1A n=1 Tax=Desulforapulum autotrophicum (strain ATCC 43914 / DSM 3382 / VKM B-1955 / HRM2) TaxID=177437 RepID=C0QLA9_DESAH|nr:PBP1A family penicillin-binding protein [Desulforapulum autotrophicum]ACN14195.1 MrcA [Desulforapulum autotrophicum HRM2]